jgi:trimeric autotransporter adhesin
VWQLEAQFRQDEGGLPDARFGLDVALSPDGQQLAIGKPFDSSAPTVPSRLSSASGSTWVYRKSAGAWSVTTKLKSTPIAPEAAFGFSLSWTDDGKMLAVGAYSDSSAGHGLNPMDDGKVQNGSGAAYLFELRP